jgi:hypothetical protein
LKNDIVESARLSGLIQKISPVHNNPWYDNQCKKMRQTLKYHLHQSRSQGNPPQLVLDYHKSKTEYKALIRSKKVAHTEKIRQSLNVCNNPTSFWNAVKGLRPRQSSSNPIPELKWKQFYQDIMLSTSTYATYEGTYDDNLDKPITTQELEAALSKTKTGKAAGTDGIPAEFYKNLNADRKHELLKILNSILENEQVPDDFPSSTTVMLHKKCDRLDPINYRPITILNASMKIFMQILTTRLTEWAEKHNILPEEQAGFRPKRSCDEQIFSLLAATQLGTRNKEKVYALFIDFKRAFPSVIHDKLWNKLYQIGVSAKIIRILQSLYKRSCTRIRLDEGLSDPIATTEGLMQGCVASPLLFTLFISDIMDVITESGISGIQINDLFTLHMLLFADDMVLLAKSPRALQLKINLLRKYFMNLGLTINVVKTQVVIFRRGGKLQSGLNFRYGEEPILIVSEYIYLGVTFSSSCLFRRAAEAAKTKGMKALGSLWPLFYRGKVNSWEVHKKLFESMVSSAVLYSSQVWGWNYEDIVEKVQSHFVRRLFQLGFKTPTFAMRLETDSYKLELTIARRTINFVVRILNMAESRIAKMCLNALIQVASSDNSRYNWAVNLKTLFTKTGHEHLWNSNNPSEIINSKIPILLHLQAQLRQADLDRAAKSVNHQYLTSVPTTQLLSTSLVLGINKARILAQLRLNQTQFYWKDAAHDLQVDTKCSYCSSSSPEDLYHFLIECRIHRESQSRFLSPLQLISNITRENLLLNIASLSIVDARKIVLYTIVALNRRKWFDEM